MKNKILMPYLLFAISVIINSSLISQTCLPDGITFSSQADVANFSLNYPDCTSIAGNVKIQGNINFIGLEQITAIEGGIICNECAGFENFQGLNNLTSLGFLSWDEGGEFDFGGLESLETVTDFIDLSEANFSDFTGLESLETVGGNFIVQECALFGFNGLVSINSIGGSFIIDENDNLFTLSIFGGLMEIGGDLIIEDNPAFANIQSFITIEEIGGALSLINNPSLTELAGLNNLESIGGALFIEEMSTLPDVNELANLTAIGGSISILDNPILTNISGIANIDSESITALQIVICPQLSVCSVESVCSFLNLSPQFSQVDSNLTNCNTIEEVLANCEVNSITEEDNTVFSLMTNQVINELVIQSNKKQAFIILDSMGRVVREVTHTGTPINVSVLSAGSYFIRAQSLEGKALRFQKM